MADPAASESPTSSSEALATSSASSAQMSDHDAFVGTRQDVAGKQSDDAAAERFANTKLNIALVNDPTRGPRFTLTKREAGLQDQDSGTSGPDPDTDQVEETDRQASEADNEPIIDHTSPASETKKADDRDGELPPEGKDGQEDARKAGDGDRGDEPKPAGTLPPSADMAPDKVPIDSSKTFVGPNGTYYDESWRWMDWRGTRRSWNWSAALSFGHWFAYRRLHGCAGLSLLWLTALMGAAVNNVPVLALAALTGLGLYLTGLYANTLYLQVFRRTVARITETGEGSYQELNDQLAAAGGTSSVALGMMVGLTLAGAASALSVTLHLRGGLLVNFWPL